MRTLLHSRQREVLRSFFDTLVPPLHGLMVGGGVSSSSARAKVRNRVTVHDAYPTAQKSNVVKRGHISFDGRGYIGFDYVVLKTCPI
jgi:hypothetical protein